MFPVIVFLVLSLAEDSSFPSNFLIINQQYFQKCTEWITAHNCSDFIHSEMSMIILYCRFTAILLPFQIHAYVLHTI